MTSRNQFTAKERAARSRLAQLLHSDELICGSVVSMARKCGKKGCHCEQGEKHVSLYLSIKMEEERRMVYIPPELEKEVRRRVEVYRESQQLTRVVSEACIHRMLEQKRNRAKQG
jgi:hypothetical protein